MPDLSGTYKGADEWLTERLPHDALTAIADALGARRLHRAPNR